ncbi:MobA/MobL family protein [Acinetobacter bereziniae]|uniref:MobA/MobL family protein n=1 Tax=Acinetobacter bereziniae TaxID=106648 RepID=UPI002952C214|nr:MobA/MobL family protein [Acinetobacter bereziniae]MDV8156639.1 MobA/MobL family protein [Acinetobacter bereziniae]
MFYFDLRHNLKYDSQKKLDDDRSKYRSSKNAYHYITRTLYFSQHKSEFEELEYSASYNMPDWTESDSSKFWQAADQYEIKRGRTSSHITIALPKELDRYRRIELSERLMHEFCGQYKMPCTIVIHNHVASLDENSEQPHLHMLFSERSMMDNIERSSEQFFKQHRSKNPDKGGALKITADVLGFGRNILFHYRTKTEKIINEFLEKYAPKKILEIHGLKFEVSSIVSCLSNEEYNKKYGTNLKNVRQISRQLLYSTDPKDKDEVANYKKEIREIRQNNLCELYKKEYKLALAKKREQEKEDTHHRDHSKDQDYDF